MEKKININSKTPTEIVDILLIYKESVEIPIKNIESILIQLPKESYHFFVMSVHNGKVHLTFNETIKK